MSACSELMDIAYSCWHQPVIQCHWCGCTESR